MKKLVRLIAFFLMLTLSCPALAATPTPPPTQIDSALVEPPAEIQKMLDLAYAEWQTLEGKKLPSVNKFTEWRNKYEWEWCAGFVTWAMLEAGIPMMELEDLKAEAKKSDDGLFHPEGLYHCKEASPGKLLRAYQLMDRASMVPQKGFILLYGCSYNRVIHVGIVYDVEDLGGGRYRITTLEGNINDSVKMFIHDYDMNASVNTNNKKSTNLSVVPEEERVIPASDTVIYDIMSSKPSSGANGKYTYYVNRFLMPWVPGDPALSTPVPEATAEPTPAPTPEPTATPAPTAEPTPGVTEEPIIADVVVLTPPPAATDAPEMTAAPEVAAEPAEAPTAEPTADPTAEPTPEPTEVPVEAPIYPCRGKDGTCTFITRNGDDPFCRFCDWNDNGVEDSKE